MNKPHILIVGPGAMGCGMAVLLTHAQAQVTLLDYKPERAKRLNRQGLFAEYQSQVLHENVRCVTSLEAAPVADLILILVKAYQTQQVAQSLKISSQSTVLTLQNGLGNYEQLVQVFPPEQVLAGTIVMGCALLEEGRVRISGVGEITVGSPSGADERSSQAAEILKNYWPAPVINTPKITTALWRKVMVNAAINPLTALTRLCNGALLDGSHLQATMHALACEVAQVAQTAGISLPDNPTEIVDEVARLTAQNRTSMLQDIEAGRMTEIDAICGAVVRQAQLAKIEAPLCQAMTGIIEAIHKRNL